jgi:hypothetical protein
MQKNAHLSPDRRYRYWLIRRWDAKRPLLCVIGLNPSTADAVQDDPTLRKVIGFAIGLEFGGVLMLNVGAYRATDPQEWKRASDPFGPRNTIRHLKSYIARFKPGKIVVAWGKNCNIDSARLRVAALLAELPRLHCWGRNADGSPRHPGRISYSTPLVLFRANATVSSRAAVSDTR